MAERFTADLAFIIIVLAVAAVLGYMIAFFIGRRIIRQWKEKCFGLEEEITGLKNRVAMLESDLNKALLDNEQYKAVTAELKNQVSLMKTELAVTHADLDEERKTLASARNELEESRKSNIDLQNQLEDSRKSYIGLQNQLEALRKEAEELKKKRRKKKIA